MAGGEMHRWSVKDSDIGTTVRMLRRHAGRRWPVILLRSLARSLVRGPRWAAEGTAEARFVRADKGHGRLRHAADGVGASDRRGQLGHAQLADLLSRS
jgi:hypothetical protein